MNDMDGRDLLSRELRDRSYDMDGHSVGLDSVKRSARRIRWRRRVAGGAVAAAVLAVAVPAGLLATGVDRGTGPVHRPPVVAGTDQPTPRPDGSYTLTMTGLPQGDQPGIGYLAGRTLHQPDGSQFALPEAYTQIAAYGDGWVARSSDVGGANAAFLDAHGAVSERFTTGNGFAVSADGSRVGYVRVQPNGANALFNGHADGSEPERWLFDVGPSVTPVGYVGRDAIVYETDGQRPEVGIKSVSGKDSVLPGLLRADGASEQAGLVSGLLTSSDNGTAVSGVVKPAAGPKPLWTTDRYTLGQFSPDGQLVVGLDTGDGIGSRSVALLDAHTGTALVRYEQGRDGKIAVPEVTWEDDGHLLAVANEVTTWQVLRLDMLGHEEQATGPVQGDPFGAFPLHLSTRP
jgi:hypothetical protein